MSLFLLLKPLAGTSTNQSKSATDVAHPTDTASVNVAGSGAGGLPELYLDVSFDASPGPAYSESVVTSFPSVYYRLDESSGPVIDTTGHLNLAVSGTVTRGAASLLPGDSNTCYDFNGTTGFLWAKDNGLLDSDDQQVFDQLTLEAVINPDSVTGIRSLIRRAITGVETRIYELRLNNGQLEFLLTDNAGIAYVYRTTQTLSVGTTYYVAAVVDETFVALYINTLLSDIFPKSWQLFQKSGGVSYVTIGSSTLAGSEFFDGRIDEPAIYELTVPNEEVLYHSDARTVSLAFTWTTVSDDAGATSSRQMSLSLKRGRQDIFRDPETGIMTTQVRNQDRRFDPGLVAGPYYPNLTPVRPCRIRVRKDGITYELFRGDVEDWPQLWEARQNTVGLTVLDAFDSLAKRHVSVTAPVELTGARINRILDNAGWSRSQRSIDIGNTLVQAWLDEAGSATELLFKINAAESGNLFVDGQGRVAFRERLSRSQAPGSTVKATFSNIPTGGELPLVDSDVGEDKDQILNHIIVRATDGVQYTAQDNASVRKYRARSLELELPLEDETEVVIKAHWILQTFKEPFIRVKEVVIEPQMDSNMWVHALSREIGDRIRFKISPPGGGPIHDLQAIIEYIEHKYQNSRWTTRWILSPADVNQYWILGTSQLGVNNKVAY